MLRNQSGNVFFAIFGAVALVGVLTAGVSTFVKGPLATSVKITRQNTAENQMSIAGQVAVMAAANAPSGGDCDGDTFVEPIEWREDLTKPFPVGGGLIPMTIGISKKDPWGTEYGYCVWDHGAATNGGGSCGGVAQKRLAGTNSKAYPVVALVSAGPDKTFTTTCRTFADADVDNDGSLDTAGVDLAMVGKASSSDDDVIFTYSYEEATGVSGGLWSLKSGDPGTAVIDKKIESTGVGSFAGGVLLPDSSLITCDATTAGIMAKNASGNGISICDGTGWEEISGGTSTPYGAGLVITPNSSSGMNVTGGCGFVTCYSTNVVFTVSNKLVPAAASAVLSTSLSNTANFEFVSNTCNGVSLAANANCQIVVRAKASGNLSYAGTLNITGNNSPLATLDGTAASFAGCNAGGQGPGGYYVACGVSGSYNLIVTPSNCSGGNTNPTCSGGNGDLSGMTDGPMVNLNDYGVACCTNASTNGALNTANLMAYSGGSLSFPAASYCDGMVYGGYSDWFLPSLYEMQTYFHPNRNSVGYSVGGNYITSTVENPAASYWYYLHTASGSGFSAPANNTGRTIRCMRRDPAAAVSPVVDNTPGNLTLEPSYGAPSVTRTSNTVTVYGITQTVAVSISGGISAQYSINGGAYTSAAGTVANGDQITVRATSPIAGQENIVTLTVGTASSSWLIRTPGNNTLRFFTTSGTYNGASVTNANCAAAASAAGLNGTWMVVAGSTGGALATRMPWNWTRLKNINGQTIATSVSDFMDGSLSAPLSYSQTGTPVSGAAWVGMTTAGYPHSNDGGYSCYGWASASGSAYNTTADPTSTAGGGYLYDNTGWRNCSGYYRLYCMESNAGGSDLDPNTVSIQPQVTFASGGTGVSNTVTITDVTDEVSVTITPSAGTANIIKNGASVGAMTTTAGLNDTLAFTLTAPTVLGTKNTATIALGPDTYSWWVGYADSSVEVKAFVLIQSGGSMGGLSGADSLCSSAAAGSSYGLAGSWKAILSDSSTDAANRIPWNWGVMKNVLGGVIVDGGYPDLLDGSIDNPYHLDRNGNPLASGSDVWTGSTPNGMRYYTDNDPNKFCVNWTTNSNYGGGMVSGLLASTGTQWLTNTAGQWCGGGYGDYIYCIENPDAGVDTTPNSFTLDYAVQVPASSRQTSPAVTIGGMSSGATQTMSVSAPGGNPKMKINGGAEVSSGSVRNGDSVVFVMDAPATGNTSNKMTITASTLTVYWRVWSGDTTGTVVKRIFVSSNTHRPDSFGGVAGADSRCQARATALALGGTWKAIISGTAENEWAVNRVGYNWSELKLVDGSTTVTYAGGLWNGSSLLSPIIKNESGVVQSGSTTMTNTDQRGFSATTTSGAQNCANWTTYYPYVTFLVGNTAQSSSPQWVYQGQYCDPGCSCTYNLYCIEQ